MFFDRIKSFIKKIYKSNDEDEKRDLIISAFKNMEYFDNDQLKEIYVLIKVMDKEISSYEFIDLLLKDRNINKYIIDFIQRPIICGFTKEANFEKSRTEGMEIIESLTKYNKDFLDIHFDKFIKAFTADNKIIVNDCWFKIGNKIEKLDEIVNIVHERIKEGSGLKNISKNDVEHTFFFSLRLVKIIIYNFVASYRLLGGRKDIIKFSSDFKII